MIPQHWSQARLAEVVECIDYGLTASADPAADGPRFLRITDIQDRQVKWENVPRCPSPPDGRYDLTTNDLVVARTGATTGKAYLLNNVPERTVFASYLIRVRVQREALNPEYLYAFTNSAAYWSQITQFSKGTAQPGANASILGGLQIPVAPPSEQCRIVAKIDALSARSKRARADLDHVEALAARAKVAIIHAAFASVDRVAKKLSIGEIARVGTGATPKAGDPRYYERGEIPWVTSGALNDEDVKQGSALVTEAALRETNCKLFTPGTILLAMYGEGKTRGKSAILSITACTNQAIAAIQCDEAIVRPRYLLRFLQGRYEKTRYAAAGGVQPNLNLSIVKAISLPVPSLATQDKIVDHVDVALAALSLLTVESTAASKLLGRLGQSILAKAFRGELVPQDPVDEPASVLLDRIRAEHAKADAPKRRGQAGRSAK